MTWDGNGSFKEPGLPQFPAVADDLIRASYFNLNIRELVAGIDLCFPRDGQAQMEAPLRMGGFKIQQLAAPTANGEAVRFEEFTALQATVNSLQVGNEPFILLNQGII